MTLISVPQPPRASWEHEGKAPSKATKTGEVAVEMSPAASVSQRLDAAFLCRLYRSVTVFAFVATLLALLATWSQGSAVAVRWTSSFASGAFLGVLLLRSQGYIVGRALSSPHDKTLLSNGQRLSALLLVPLKYLLIAVGLSIAIKVGGLNLIAFGIGFFVTQMAIFAKVIGWILTQRVKNVRDTFIA